MWGYVEDGRGKLEGTNMLTLLSPFDRWKHHFLLEPQML